MAFWTFPTKGWQWSLIAGTLGALGALGVLLAFGKMPSPAYVPVIMSVIFAGAPIVNAIVSTTKEGNWPNVKWPFILGIAMAARRRILERQNMHPKPLKPTAPAEVSKTNNFFDDKQSGDFDVAERWHVIAGQSFNEHLKVAEIECFSKKPLFSFGKCQ